MKLIHLKNFSQKQLSYLEAKSDYPREECLHLILRLLEHHFDMFQSDIVADRAIRVSERQMAVFEKYIERIVQNEPIQYILGEVEFYDLKLKVNKHVLIPRPETEELVDFILSSIPKEKHQVQTFSILDIGTGSGCIALALAKNLPLAEVSAVDISQEALDLAEENAYHNQVKVRFIKADLLNTVDGLFSKPFDIIVSNPPYVLEAEKVSMRTNVLDFEPHLALFVPNESPLLFYEKITDFATKHLEKQGKLYFEINEKYGQAVKLLLENTGFRKVQITRDMQKKMRFVWAFY